MTDAYKDQMILPRVQWVVVLFTMKHKDKDDKISYEQPKLDSVLA